MSNQLPLLLLLLPLSLLCHFTLVTPQSLHWNAVNPYPSQDSYSDSATGNGVSVLIGATGIVITSTDGYKWKDITASLPLDSDFQVDSVCYSTQSKSFVATASKIQIPIGSKISFAMLRSIDGAHWITTKEGNVIKSDSIPLSLHLACGPTAIIAHWSYIENGIYQKEVQLFFFKHFTRNLGQLRWRNYLASQQQSSRPQCHLLGG